MPVEISDHTIGCGRLVQFGGRVPVLANHSAIAFSVGVDEFGLLVVLLTGRSAVYVRVTADIPSWLND